MTVEGNSQLQWFLQFAEVEAGKTSNFSKVQIINVNSLDVVLTETCKLSALVHKFINVSIFERCEVLDCDRALHRPVVRAKQVVASLVELVYNQQARVILEEDSIAVGRRLVRLVDIARFVAVHFVCGQEINLRLSIVREVALEQCLAELIIFRLSHFESFLLVCIVQLFVSRIESIVQVTHEEAEFCELVTLHPANACLEILKIDLLDQLRGHFVSIIIFILVSAQVPSDETEEPVVDHEA